MSKKFRRNIFKIKNDFEMGKNLPKLPKIKSKRSFALKNDLNKRKTPKSIKGSSNRFISYNPKEYQKEKNYQSVRQNLMFKVDEEEEPKWEKHGNGTRKDFKKMFTKSSKTKKLRNKNLTNKRTNKNHAKNLTKKNPKGESKKSKTEKFTDRSLNDEKIHSVNQLLKRQTIVDSKKSTTKRKVVKKKKRKKTDCQKSKREIVNSLQNTKEVIHKRQDKTVNKKKKRSVVHIREEIQTLNKEENLEMQKTIKSKDSKKKDTIFCVIKGYKDSYFVNGKELNGINELIDYIKSKRGSDPKKI